MALVTRYINTASTPGGDGTTNATAGANRAYASFSEWESNEQTNLVTDGDTHLVICTGSSADTSNAFVIGWTVDSTHFITIRNSEDPLGVYNTSMYRLERDDNTVLNIAEGFTVIEKMQVKLNIDTTTSTINGMLINSSSGGIIVDRCISRATKTGSGTGNTRAYNIGSNSTSGVYHVIVNSLGYDSNFGSAPAGFYSNVPSDVAIYYCTLINSCEWGGFRGTAGHVWKNNISDDSVASTPNCYNGGASNKNLSSDATGNPASLQNKNPTYVNEGADDFKLAAGSDGIGVGDDLSADVIYPVSTDVLGNTRPASPSVGFHEPEVATVPPKWDYYYRRRRI